MDRRSDDDLDDVRIGRRFGSGSRISNWGSEGHFFATALSYSVLSLHVTPIFFYFGHRKRLWGFGFGDQGARVYTGRSQSTRIVDRGGLVDGGSGIRVTNGEELGHVQLARCTHLSGSNTSCWPA